MGFLFTTILLLFIISNPCLASEPSDNEDVIYYDVAKEDKGVADAAFEHYNAALIHFRVQEYDAAISHYESAIALFPSFAQAHNNLGTLYDEITVHESKAIDHYNAAYTAAATRNDTDTMTGALNNMGHFYHKRAGKSIQEMQKAISYFEEALKVDPFQIDALYNKASVLNAVGHFDAALPLYRDVLEMNPLHTGANIDVGNIYFLSGDFHAALGIQQKLLSSPLVEQLSKTEIVNVLNNKGQYLRDASFVKESLEAYEAALQIIPDHAPTLVNVVNAKRQLCNWEGEEVTFDRLVQLIDDSSNDSNNIVIIQPYDAMLLPHLNPAWLTRISQQVSSTWLSSNVLYQPRTLEASKLRVGYLSYDFRDHPMGHLTLGALKNHDSRLFDIIGFSYGPNDESNQRQEAIAATQNFIDLQNASDLEAASIIASYEIDILIDLMGHTRGTRLGIIALAKPAPVIINYLGYPGTTGITEDNYYIVLDPIVCPVAEDASKAEAVFTERKLYLPFVYQVNEYFGKDIIKEESKDTNNDDGDTVIKEFKRKGFFIFCDFNTINKMESRSFSLWMKVLARVPRSVLWLLAPAEPLASVVIPTLRMAASVGHGIDPSRIIFAPRVSKSEHLARLPLADLFLDTMGYNAHTTAADALWTGVPIITLIGNTFASRVAASFLSSVSLEACITHSQKEFEDLAVSVATFPRILQKLKDTLVISRLTAPLFQNAATTVELERAYQCAFELNLHCVIIVSTRQDYFKIWWDVAVKWHEDGHLIQAEAAYKRLWPVVLKLYARDYEAELNHLQGVLYHQQDQPEKALPYLKRAVELNPNSRMFYENLGRVYWALWEKSIGGDTGIQQLAMEAFHSSLSIEFSYQAFMSYAALLEDAQDYVELVFWYQMWIENREIRDTSDEIQHIMLQHSAALAHAGFKANAIDFLSSVVIPKFPTLFSASYNAAALLKDLGKHDDANAVFLSTAYREHVYQYSHNAERIPRPAGVPSIAIYCYEYGQTWWKAWGPSTLESSGLGGSEEAVVFIARELAALGFWVEVYGNPPEEDIGVQQPTGEVWYNHAAFDVDDESLGMFVAWRYHISTSLCNSNSKCYIWLQDMPGDSAFTDSYVDSIDGIFCLSKFHKSTLSQYAQSKGIITRNALDPSFFVDGENRHNVFTYGSAPNRGLQTVLRAWKEISSRVSDATLHVYYGFTDSVVSFVKSNSNVNYTEWRAELDMLLTQEGVVYHGMVDHTTLAHGYAAAGFYLYPTVFPETGCVSIMKSQALGAIPITSRFAGSVLPEASGKFDLGPETPLKNEGDPEWTRQWIEAVVHAAKASPREAIDRHRREMIEYARSTFLWSRVALVWQETYNRKK